MDQGPYLIDTNVFVIDLRYPRDRNFGVNRRFLDAIKRERCGVTTTINARVPTCFASAAFSRSTSISGN